MEVLMEAAASILAKEGLKAENIERAIGLVRKSGRKLSNMVMECMEKRKHNHESSVVEEIPLEVQEEIRHSLKEILKEHARPVYMGGVAFFCGSVLENETKVLLEKILTNIDDDMEGTDWENEQDIRYQENVDRFLWKYCGRPLNGQENDYFIGNDFIYLNFPLEDDEDYYRVYDGEAVSNLADALNHLLGDKYIIQFTVY